MDIRRLTYATVTAVVIGASALAATPAVAVAQPGQPCRSGDCRGPGGGPQAGHDGPGRPGGPGGPGRPDGPGGPRWDAPPPPPRDQGWRGIDQGRYDHQPFNYRGSWVTPIFNPEFRNWGFWFFGLWIPL
ncbi:hypothetical protein [Mycolicibacterium arseniciresistens]|jgi:hypothetical protein|uniref:Chitin-binding protein n=1 Tax=Mycolicibacterium arseniciresistens TaxID=3062257 RepID=A0ABT8UR85_9MYCO|nr:hypothetical protein [Mycolicibacterium arseniciresistens]MDO3639295.1 hypothetical protein [Mycolicibacterium arseniciresistens]